MGFTTTYKTEGTAYHAEVVQDIALFGLGCRLEKSFNAAPERQRFLGFLSRQI